MIRVVLVDDQPSVRAGLQMRLALEADIVVVGEVGDGREALATIRNLSPDIVVMDIEMPQLDGIEIISILQQTHRHIPVIVLSIHDDPVTRQRAVAAGAAAFVAKHESDDVFLATIRRVVQTQPRA